MSEPQAARALDVPVDWGAGDVEPMIENGTIRKWALASLFALALSQGCGRQHPIGRFVYHDLESEVEGRTLAYGVYLPPRSRWDGKTPLPLVVLLHGARDDESSADRRRVVEALDEAIDRGELPPFIMVTPRGELGFWVNWKDGSHRYRDWVLDEVVPDARRRYPLEPESLHLVGVSMGGGGGLQMWLRERARFSSGTFLSAPILSSDETRNFLARFLEDETFARIFGPKNGEVGVDPYVALRSPEDLHGSRLVFGAARRERPPILESNVRFHEHLEERGVPHTFLEFRGRHGWKAWARAFPKALRIQLGAEN